MTEAERDDPEAVEAEAVEEEAAPAESEWHARKVARYDRERVRGQHGPAWGTANESDKELALKVLVHLGGAPKADAASVSEAMGVRFHEAYSALWILRSSKFIRRERGAWIVEEGAKA